MFKFSTAPGRGISKEDAAKRNYFDIFGRHFAHILGANFWYVLTNGLFFLAAYILINAYLIGADGENLVKIVAYFLGGKNFLLPFIPFVPFMFIGPFTAGYTYVIRNYAKQEPTFLVSDFFEHTKRNLLQSFLVSAISTVIAYLLIQALIFYNSFFFENGLPLGVLYTIAFFLFALFVIFEFYIYPIIVTFKMKLGVALKNAWTFTMLKLPQNMIIFIFLALVNFGLFYLFTFVFYLPGIFHFILLAFFLSGFTAFTANFYIWGILDKYIVSYVKPKRSPDAIFNDDEFPDAEDYEEVEIEDEYLL